MHVEATSGRRRSLDAHVNPVPYIDMLMTLMLFLMATASFSRLAPAHVGWHVPAMMGTDIVSEAVPRRGRA